MVQQSNISINRVPGLLRLGVIVSFDPVILQVQVYLGSFRENKDYSQDFNNIVQAQLPISYFNSSGMFVGGYPHSGTPVIISQGDGNEWFVVSMISQAVSGLSTILPSVPTLDPGTFYLQADPHTFIQLSQTNGISLGEDNNTLILDTNRDIMSNTFDNSYLFTEGSREINGLIKRDVQPNINTASSLRETDLRYNETLKTIGLDPVFKIGTSNIGSAIRNPARIEKREVVFEYARSYNIADDNKEFLSYKDNKNIIIGDILNRRESRADALNLSLVSPNYLMETIKGTVVDTRGNVLDINRSILPLGKTDKVSIRNIKHNLEENAPLGNVFNNIKILERRGIAYHFELNAKKDTTAPPDPSDNSDYARERSRLFIDIDKEGMMKVNIPASSETGNIPLLTRYENFSTVNPNEKSNDPNDTVFNTDPQDILIESFIGDNGIVEIMDDLDGNASPIDRFSPKDSPVHIKHGTAYHNIAETCNLWQSSNQATERPTMETTFIGRGLITPKTDIITKQVISSGDKANAGGRSGSLNFDGSLDINIGANTIDRHSVWLDMAGSMLANIGRDSNGNNISMGVKCDGEILIQSGGGTVDTDSRFITDTINNGNIAGAIDIRVINSTGATNIIRISDNGIEIHSESRILVYSNGDMELRSTGHMRIEAEDLTIQNRRVRKDVGLGSI